MAGDRRPTARGRHACDAVADHVAAVSWRRGRGGGAWRVDALEPSGPAPSSRGRTRTSRTTSSTEASTRRRSGWPARPASVAESLGLHRRAQRRAEHRGVRVGRPRPVWSPLLHRSLEIAEGTRPGRAGRPRVRQPVQPCTRRTSRIAEGEGLFVEGIAYCDEHDIGTFGNCLRGERATCWSGSVAGRSPARSRRGPAAGSAPSPVNRLNPLAQPRPGCGPGAAADGVWACLDEALDAGRRSGEPDYRAGPDRPGRGVLAARAGSTRR